MKHYGCNESWSVKISESGVYGCLSKICMYILDKHIRSSLFRPLKNHGLFFLFRHVITRAPRPRTYVSEKFLTGETSLEHPLLDFKAICYGRWVEPRYGYLCVEY